MAIDDLAREWMIKRAGWVAEQDKIACFRIGGYTGLRSESLPALIGDIERSISVVLSTRE